MNKSSIDEPVIQLMNNHEAHCTFGAIDVASNMLPHTSHRLQPLDVSVFVPFKTFYNQGLDLWHISRDGKTFSIFNVAEIIGTAFHRALSTKNICCEFKHTGIYPLDEGIVIGDQYLPSSVTDRFTLHETDKDVTVSSAEVIKSTEDKAIAGPSSRPDDLTSPNQSDLALMFISP